MAAFKNKDNGTWYVQFRYTDWKGERRQKLKRGFATKREALEWERELSLIHIWATGTLSGGEAQRIRLATQIGSGLVGVAYILDEPSIGLHQRDNDKLLKTLTHLRDLGNSVIVVEHDEDTMMAADCIVDIGPGAGEHGGKVVGPCTIRRSWMVTPSSRSAIFKARMLRISATFSLSTSMGSI